MNKNLFKPLLERYVSSWTVLLCDTVTSLLASALVLVIAQMLGILVSIRFGILWLIGACIISALMFFFMRTYKSIIRYSTFHDIAKVILAVIGKGVLLMLLMLIFVNNTITFSNLIGMVLLDITASCCMLVAERIVIMLVIDIVRKRILNMPSRQRVLIYIGGDNEKIDKSVSLVTRLKNSPHYTPVGFIGYGTRLKGSHLSGLPVYYFESSENLSFLHSTLGLDGIIFGYADEARKESERLIKYCIENDIKTLVTPTIDEMADGKPINNSNIRKIKIEDLLSRPEIKVSMNEIKENFAGKTILVTGAAGSIGSELCRQLATFGIRKLIMFDNAETPLHNVRLEFEDKYPDLDFVPMIGDVRQEERLDYAFRKYHPQVVFQAAAYKHVPLMEENPCEAVRVNVIGSQQVADKCVQYGAELMVMVSTDKAVNPTNIMGCTKRLAEIYVQSLGLALQNGQIEGKTRFVTTRFGNVLGSNGSVIPRFTEQIEHGGPVTVTHPDIVRFFMTIPEACRLVMEAATMTTGNQIFVFDMGEAVKIRHLAEQMIKLAGFEVGTEEEAAKRSNVIAISYTGLRPGEKLYEEVLASNENTIPTDHNRIHIARVREYDYAEAQQVVRQLDKLSRAVEIPDMIRLMKHTVPEFISKNSEFEIYDKEK